MEQDEFDVDSPLDDAPGPTRVARQGAGGRPERGAGAAAAGRRIRPAEGEDADRLADAVAADPRSEDVRIVVAVSRDGDTACGLRLRGTSRTCSPAPTSFRKLARALHNLRVARPGRDAARAAPSTRAAPPAAQAGPPHPPWQAAGHARRGSRRWPSGPRRRSRPPRRSALRFLTDHLTAVVPGARNSVALPAPRSSSGGCRRWADLPLRVDGAGTGDVLPPAMSPGSVRRSCRGEHQPGAGTADPVEGELDRKGAW